MSVESVRDFSRGLISVLEENEELRKRNLALEDKLAKVEDTVKALSLGMGVEDFCNKIKSLKDMFPEEVSSTEPNSPIVGELASSLLISGTLLDSFQKHLTSKNLDYVMFKQLFAQKHGELPTLIAGPMLYDTILGKAPFDHKQNFALFTFNFHSVQIVLLRHGFKKVEYTNLFKREYLKDGKIICDAFLVYSFDCRTAGIDECTDYIKAYFGREACVTYDGNEFKLLHIKETHKLAMRDLQLRDPSLYVGRAIFKFDNGDLTLRALNSHNLREHA